MNASEQPVHALACYEVWGGNQRTEGPVELPGLEAWVYARPSGESESGGDVHYLSVCGEGRLTRVGLADVSGHGLKVSEAATCLRDLLRKHIQTLDQSDLLRDLNRSFQTHCVLEAGFASFIFLGLYGETGRLVFTNGGHPPPLWYRSDLQVWTILRDCYDATGTEVSNLPFGLIPGTNYNQSTSQLARGDLLVLYSDGLLESRNPEGEMLGAERLLKMVEGVPVESAEAAGCALATAVREFRRAAPAHDDITLLVLQRLPA